MEARRRRGRDVDIPWRRGDAAAATRIFRGGGAAAAATRIFRGGEATPRPRRGETGAPRRYDYTDARKPLAASDDFLYGTAGALDAIERGLKIAPTHPGLLHLKIHALEMGRYGSNGPILACVPAADALLEVARGTDCGHLLHMPAHARLSGNLARWS